MFRSKLLLYAASVLFFAALFTLPAQAATVTVTCQNYEQSLTDYIASTERLAPTIDRLNDRILFLYERRLIGRDAMSQFFSSRTNWYALLETLRGTRARYVDLMQKWEASEYAEQANTICANAGAVYEEARNVSATLLQLQNSMFDVLERLKTRVATTNDPNSDEQYYLTSVAADSYLGISGQRNVIVAVLDDGVYVNHEDLRQAMWKNMKEIPGNGIDDDRNGYVDDVFGYNFLSGNSEMTVHGDHGTGVAGIIGAGVNNGIGIAGFGQGISIMPLIVCGETGCSSNAVSAAIRYAVDNGAEVINLSLSSRGTSSYTAAYDDAIRYAFSRGVVVVAAAGNGDIEGGVGQDLGFTPQSPVCNDGTENMVLGVGAVDELFLRTSWSNYGKCVDVVAPGASIVSAGVPAISGGLYVSGLNGTSFAAPIVSGIAAKLKQKYPTATAAEIIDLITRSANDGVANLDAAMRLPFTPSRVTPISAMPVSALECDVSGSDGACTCASGYAWNDMSRSCTAIQESAPAPAPVPVVSPDPALVRRLLGRILLQVEAHGEAWYVNPVNSLRYYLRDGAAAYGLMRSFGLGITTADLEKIPAVASPETMRTSSSVCGTNVFARSLSGKILLQVQAHGEAWYVDPTTCRRIYMKDGAAAYEIMRFLGLGITDANLGKIPAAQ